jgi:glycosyltransferase involved in cell wall biosynthesis
MLGFIARCDNTGLGVESADVARWLHPDRVLVVTGGGPRERRDEFPERFASCPTRILIDRAPTTAQLDELLVGLDTLLFIETPYDWSIVERAKQLGVKTVLRINYECLPEVLPIEPDVMIAPIDWRQPSSVRVLPFPVDRTRFPFRRRHQARTFVHVAGHQGLFGRNGTAELLQAIPLVESDVRFIIYSQNPIEAIDDPRLRLSIADCPDNRAFFAEGDVLVFPRRYGGQALAMNEALSSGMPVMMTDMPPQSSFLPKELLIQPQRFEKARVMRDVDVAVIEPAAIARRIDEWANRDISRFSDWADAYAESISWPTLLPEYVRLLSPGA